MPEPEPQVPPRGVPAEHLGARVRWCRAADLRPLEWDGAFRAHRLIYEETFQRQERGGAVMLIADVGGFPAGQVWIELERQVVPELWALRVHPSHQRRGLGALLIRAGEAELVRRGAERVRICVEPHNAGALALYRQLGYEQVAERTDRISYRDPDHGWIERVVDVLVLEKPLCPP